MKPRFKPAPNAGKKGGLNRSTPSPWFKPVPKRSKERGVEPFNPLPLSAESTFQKGPQQIFKVLEFIRRDLRHVNLNHHPSGVIVNFC